MLSPLRYLFINDDQQTFTCILPTQYSIFSVNSFEMKYSRKNFGFSLGSAVTCQGYRYIAFSGLPADPEFDTRHVCIFDHEKIGTENEKETTNNPLIFLHGFDVHVLSMRITPQYLIAAFHHHIEVWDIKANKPLQQINTALNIHAPCDITRDYKLLVVAGREIYNCDLYQLTNNPNPFPIRAADETVSLVKFSRTPGFLATASLDGKIVRVFDTSQIKEGSNMNNFCIGKFKRGFKASIIHSIDFSPNNQFMAIISQNGTLHFFDLKNKSPTSNPQTYTSISKISIGQQDVSYIMWISPSLIIVLTMAGMMISISIDDENCNEVGREELNFLRLCDDIQM